MDKIRVGICGFGNLGRGVSECIRNAPDMKLKAIFTRRDPEEIKDVADNVHVYSFMDMDFFRDDIDVMIITMGSKEDLPEFTPMLADKYNLVDSFDNHGQTSEHFKKVDEAALSGNKTALISAGWDPGLFSLMRLMGEAFLPNGKTNTFWGRGISQGHSDAIRRIEGVADARQYTVPDDKIVEEVRNGSVKDYSKKEMHKRECFVALKEGADPKEIERKIKTMPDYFEGYETKVHFVSSGELHKNHSQLSHGGFVIRAGETGIDENKEIMELSLNLQSNPQFTASLMIAFARAVYRMNKLGEKGAKTIFDIKPKWLSPLGEDEIIERYL